MYIYCFLEVLKSYISSAHKRSIPTVALESTTRSHVELTEHKLSLLDVLQKSKLCVEQPGNSSSILDRDALRAEVFSNVTDCVNPSKLTLQTLYDVMALQSGWVRRWEEAGEAAGIVADRSKPYIQELKSSIKQALEHVKLYVDFGHLVVVFDRHF